ncbi:hypothetical protein ACHAXT_010285 [Thalassiosira profunda]
MTNGVFGEGQRPPPQAPAVQANGPLPSTNSMQWQHTPSPGHQTSHTAANRHHSFSSSMELMTATGPSRPVGAPSDFQNHLFRSSSHHTSHTAAAGDLLTMSRRALDPPPSNPAGGGAKKRSSYGNDSCTGQSAFGGMDQTISQPAGQSQQMQGTTFGQPAQQQHFRAQQSGDHAMGQQTEGMFPNGGHQGTPAHQNQAIPAFRTYVSSSTVGSEGDNDDSHQHHRSVRRCRRSDSFEMIMEDG